MGTFERGIPELAVACLLMAVALAGCTGSPSTSPAAPANDSPDVVTDPTNYTYVDNASLETGGHVHDYWDGKDRLVVMDETRSTNANWFGASGFVVRFQPPAGKVVPQGTAKVEVTIEWTENPGNVFQDPELWAKTAEDNETLPIGPVENGATIEINTTNGMSDLPHRQLSSWMFGLYIHGEGVDNGSYHRFQSQVSIEVEAIRGLPLPVFPAHPDPWDGRDAIPLVEDSWATLLWKPEENGYGPYCIGACRARHAPMNGTIVPFNASRVRVEITPDGAPTRIDLAYHGADTRQWTRLRPDETDGATRIYEIPITETMGDSPYAEQSLWRWKPYVSEPTEDGLYSGGYEINATAYRTTDAS